MQFDVGFSQNYSVVLILPFTTPCLEPVGTQKTRLEGLRDPEGRHGQQ